MNQEPEELFNIREVKGKDFYKIMIVNEALKNFDKKHLFPWLLQITIDIKNKTELFGLPTTEEANTLNTMEDDLVELVNSTIKYQYVGRLTQNSQRILYYYIQRPKEVHEKLSSLIEDRSYLREFEYSISKDPDWEKTVFFFDY